MSIGKMHADEIETDAPLVRRLLASQFPRWANLPIERVQHSGTDHAIYRLGDDLSVRLPRIAWAAGQPEKEDKWLRVLAPHLPVAIPVPLAKGQPSDDYPWEWVVSPWLPGENATRDRIGDQTQVAVDLARFITALQRIDSAGGPRPGPGNFLRGVPLAVRDPRIRTAIPEWDGILDTSALTAAWESALHAPEWRGAPVWLHGDLLSGNVLLDRGRVSAVIDFGCLGVGDPACDLSVAWTLLSAEGRQVFRAAVSVDDATWARARGWAMMGAGSLPYYRETNPLHVSNARRALCEVLSDVQSNSVRSS